MQTNFYFQNVSAAPDALYRYTLRLLKHYRNYGWQLKVLACRTSELTACQEWKHKEHTFTSFCQETGVSQDDNHELEQLWNQAALLSECLSSINRFNELIRNHHPCGELYYWILYYTYLSPEKPAYTEDILDLLAKQGYPVPRRSYFRKRRSAVETLAMLVAQKRELWDPGE